MRAYDLILKKRNGEVLNNEEISFLINGYVRGDIADYQMAAFLMAVYFRHLNHRETAGLTECMRYSGDTINLDAIKGRKVDKHSTGGVGDKTTLSLAPMVAACGAKVAKLSGRGLGHTGGTIDKLEAIPGFRTSMSNEEWIKQVNDIGVAIAGQTANLVPADKKIYALRDVTATVDELSLIASSIMSKKLASGADAFVLDIKVGSGAFMKDLESARELAKTMVEIAGSSGHQACGVITNMDQPLGNKVGNALEVIEALETLQNQGPSDFTELCIELGKQMLIFALDIDETEAEKRLEDSLSSGTALEKFREFISAQGGSTEFIDHPATLIKETRQDEYKAGKSGIITGFDTEKIGVAAMTLGAGRAKKGDQLDFAVGFDFKKKIGDKVQRGEGLLTIYYNSGEKLERALEILEDAIVIEQTDKWVKKDLIFDIIK